MSTRRQIVTLLAMGIAASTFAGCASDAPRVAQIQPQTVSHPATRVNGWFAEVIDARSPGHEHIVETDPVGAYLLDSGDRLRVFVYDQPNLSRAYVVDHDGYITVPLIGRVSARGKTTSAVQHSVRRKLAAKYIRRPQVTVDIIQNRPFFIYGEVRQAGQFPYVSGMTIETAIAIAGGYSERASRRSYRVTRRENGYARRMDVDKDFPIEPGDTVYVRERFF